MTSAGSGSLAGRVVCLMAALGVGTATLAAGESQSATATAPRVTLRWQAVQEADVYGYVAYRADRREGPFLRVNREIVRARGAVDAPASYELVDAGVEPGRTYFYYLDVVTASGRKQRFSGVIRKLVEPPE